MPELIIDHRKIEVAEDTKVIEAAEALGIFIPRFCYHPALGAVGACRVCAVKFLDGPVKGIEMSCMITARDGMEVSTTHPDAVAFRKYIIECLMINHPHDCPVCDEGGHCLLQDFTVAGGHGIRQYKGPKRTYTDQYLGPLVQHEMNRCIQCYRCVRYYQEYTGYTDLGVMGIASRIYYGRFEHGCLESPFSGNLIDICPTGVYTDKPSRYSGRRWEFERSRGICIHCATGCNTTVSTRYRAIVRQEARYNPDVNGHFICDRGRYGFYYANLEQRPRRGRVGENVVPTGHAIAAAAEKITEIEATWGPSAIAVFGSDRSSLQTLAGLRAVCEDKGWQPPVLWTETLGNTVQTAVSALSPDLAVSMGVIESADFILMAGADPVNEAPMLAMALRQAQRKNCRIRVADPRPIELPFPFEQIPCRGNEMVGLLQQVIDALDENSADNPSEIQELADGLMNSNRPVIICGTQITDQGVAARAGKLAQTLKKRHRRTRLFFILPHANTYGAALLFRNHQPVETILEKIEQGEVKAVITLESDIWEQFPDRIRLERAIKILDLMVVIDCLDNPLAHMAHIQIPSQSVFEAGGIFVNQEGRVQYSNKAQAGGLPIAVTGRGTHPPRTFQAKATGADILPVSKALQDISKTPFDTFSDEGVSWMERTFPELAGLSKILAHNGETDAARLYAENEIGGCAVESEAPPSGMDFELLTVACIFGGDVLSSHSPCLAELGEKDVWISARDARDLKIAHGDEIILELPRAPLKLNAGLSDRMASGILVIPRRYDLFWQQCKSGNRLFINQASIQINKEA